MAIMWPRALPSDVLANTLRSTECQVYRRLEAVLDDSFIVFYSRPWLGVKPDGEEIDGECDFVVAHAELGFLSLEVKGGAVAYDPRTEKWTSKDRWGLTHNIKNPVQQARSSKHQLLEKLSNSPHWKSRFIRARHAVVLPHSAAPVGDLGADMPLDIFCFQDDFEESFREWLSQRFGPLPEKGGKVKELGKDGIFALEKTLAKPFQLRTPLGSLLSGDDAALQVLTQQQFYILRAIEEVKRAAICGGAGTGKTVLAVEEARRCAENGLRTLFVCFNRGLAVDVQQRLGESVPVQVMTFHQLCASVVSQAGMTHPDEVPNTRLFEEIYPELLMQAFERHSESKFDAIIVDEGQDFFPLWWSAVDSGLDPDGHQLLRIFYDNNQRVYASAVKIPEDVALVPIRLTLNMRNTRRIHELILPHYKGHAIDAVGPEGVEVKWMLGEEPEGLKQKIIEYIGRLTSIENVAADDIAVLFSTENEAEQFALDSRLRDKNIAKCDEPREDAIIMDSVRRFKGLERPVVIVSVTPDMVVEKELPYVAVSRARTHLVLAGAGKVLDKMRG